MKYVIQIVVSLCLVILCNCKTEPIENKTIDTEILCISSFNFGSKTLDTTRHFNATSYLFKKDSVIILKTDSNYNWKIGKAKLSYHEIDTLNKLFSIMNLKLYYNNTIIQNMRKNMEMYCGEYYGFIDTAGRVEVFVPVLPHNVCRDFMFKQIYFKVTEQTVDTSAIIKYTQQIKSRYFQVSPPFPVMEEVKFVKPVIHNDKIEK